MTKFLAVELRGDGIRVNSIAPGLIKTDFAKNLWESGAVPDEAIGTSDQIGSVSATICSKDGSFMNGEIYAVHGGFPNL